MGGVGRRVGFLSPHCISPVQVSVRRDLNLEPAFGIELSVNFWGSFLHQIGGKTLVVLDGHSVVLDQSTLSWETLALSPWGFRLPYELHVVLLDVFFARECLQCFRVLATNGASPLSGSLGRLFFACWSSLTSFDRGNILIILTKGWCRHSCRKLKVLRSKEVCHRPHMLSFDAVVMHRLCLGHFSFHVFACYLQRSKLDFLRGGLSAASLSNTIAASLISGSDSSCERINSSVVCRLRKRSLVEGAQVLDFVASLLWQTRFEALVENVHLFRVRFCEALVWLCLLAVWVEAGWTQQLCSIDSCAWNVVLQSVAHAHKIGHPLGIQWLDILLFLHGLHPTVWTLSHRHPIILWIRSGRAFLQRVFRRLLPSDEVFNSL